MTNNAVGMVYPHDEIICRVCAEREGFDLNDPAHAEALIFSHDYASEYCCADCGRVLNGSGS